MELRIISITNTILKVVFWILLTLTAVIFVSGIVMTLLSPEQRGGKMTVPLGLHTDRSGIFISSAGETPVEMGKTTSKITLNRPPGELVLLLLANTLLGFIPTIYVVRLRSTIFTSMKHESPFTLHTAASIKKIGIAIFIIAFIVPLLQTLNYLTFRNRLIIDGLTPQLDNSNSPGQLNA